MDPLFIEHATNSAPETNISLLRWLRSLISTDKSGVA